MVANSKDCLFFNKLIIIALLSLASLVLTKVTYAFELSGFSWADSEATFFSSPDSVASIGLTSTQVTTAFTDALDEWSNVTAFNFKTTTGSSDPCNTSTNSYTFADTNCGSAFGSNTLAVTTTFFTGNGSVTRSRIVFNATKNWSITGVTTNSGSDFRRVAVHELGHSLGLDHTDVSLAIMQPSIGDTQVPQTDDLNGVAAIYGVFDTDGDGVGNNVDNCVNDINSDQADFNNDGEGDVCDDTDNDTVFDDVDNCPLVSNQNQAETGSASGVGDACDSDDDGFRADVDNCPSNNNPDQADLDSDGTGNDCDNDADGDTVLTGADDDDLNQFICSDTDVDSCDDCSSGTFNVADDGVDTDSDGLCDNGEVDDDGDGVNDIHDNCQFVANPNQQDSSGNDIGDSCEEDDFCLPIKTSNNKLAVICL